MKAWTKTQFLSQEDLPLVPVELDDGFGVFVRTWTGEERSEFERTQLQGKDYKSDPGLFRWMLLQRCVMDGEGNHLFDAKDRKEVMGKSAGMLEKVFNSICEVNGFTEKDVKDIEKK